MADVVLGGQSNRVGGDVDDGDRLPGHRRDLDGVAGRDALASGVHQQDDADIAGPKVFMGQIPGQDYDLVFREQLAHC
jgi:hypothetical protein